MHSHCPVCRQKFEMEPGFWYGTGYISYALTVAISAVCFVGWLLLIGISTEDNRVFYWLGFNSLLLIALQPLLMRLSRVIYICFFVKYDEDYQHTKPKSYS